MGREECGNRRMWCICCGRHKPEHKFDETSWGEYKFQGTHTGNYYKNPPMTERYEEILFHIKKNQEGRFIGKLWYRLVFKKGVYTVYVMGDAYGPNHGLNMLTWNIDCQPELNTLCELMKGADVLEL